MSELRNPYGVKEGDIWTDCDPRRPISEQRSLYVQYVNLTSGKAGCRIGATDRTTEIQLTRFKPTSNGYRRVKKASDA